MTSQSIKGFFRSFSTRLFRLLLAILPSLAEESANCRHSICIVVYIVYCIVFRNRYIHSLKHSTLVTSKQVFITQTLLFIWYWFIITILYRFTNRKMRLSSKIPLQSTQNTVINSGHLRRHFFS